MPSPSFQKQGGAILYTRDLESASPLPRAVFSPLQVIILVSFLFFFPPLLVSSNTYIVWGETESIHSPQKAIHLKAAGEAKCSPCPLHSWMSFVQSLGLEPFPPQIQAINESAMEKGKKISQCFACPQFVHFLFARKFFWLGPRRSRKTATFLGKEKGSNVCSINMYLCFFFYTRGQLSVWK